MDDINKDDLFCDYYEKWIKIYKEGAIRKVTLDKYKMTKNKGFNEDFLSRVIE